MVKPILFCCFWVALALSFPFAEGSPSDRCYAMLSCRGDVAPLLETSVVGNIQSFDSKAYFSIDTQKPFPNLTTIQSMEPGRFQAFESACNQERYRKLKLPPDEKNANIPNWSSDSRHLAGEVKMVCYAAGQCSQLGQGCTKDSDCCSRPMAYPRAQCNLNTGACVMDSVSSANRSQDSLAR